MNYLALYLVFHISTTQIPPQTRDSLFWAQDIYWNFQTADLRRTDLLDKIVIYLQRRPRVKFEVIMYDHPNPIYSAIYIKKRAESIIHHLAKNGIPQSRLSARVVYAKKLETYLTLKKYVPRKTLEEQFQNHWQVVMIRYHN